MKKEYIYILIGIVIFYYFDKIMNMLGLNKTNEQINNETQAAALSEFPQWASEYQDTVTFRKIPAATVKSKVKELRKSMRGLGTKENNLYSVFQSLYNKANISQLSYQYYIDYNRNLKNDVLNELKKKEKSYLYEIISNLPDYE